MTSLKALEISSDMIEIAKGNAREYGFDECVEYVKGNAQRMPFGDETFDGVFTNGSLHEWSQPEEVFNEIHRVLKPGGKYFISDLRRDMNFFIKWFMHFATRPKEIRPGLTTSINAAYTPDEIKNVIKLTSLKDAYIASNPMGIEIYGKKF
ncbi:MAG: class I SAM-dependent methyltransferase [Actinobacteria bacterium]|nr:class I SAM-dependent methyltransferase [Actinomycetota bacterium]